MRKTLLVATIFGFAAGPAMACEFHNKMQTTSTVGEETVVMSPVPLVPVEQDVATAPLDMAAPAAN